MPCLPWQQIQTCLEMIPEWEYKSNYSTALSAYMSGSAFGGMKDTQPHDLLPPWARPAWLEGGGKSEVRLTLKGAEGKAFRLGLRKGLISQRLLSLFSAS